MANAALVYCGEEWFVFWRDVWTGFAWIKVQDGLVNRCGVRIR